MSKVKLGNGQPTQTFRLNRLFGCDNQSLGCPFLLFQNQIMHYLQKYKIFFFLTVLFFAPIYVYAYPGQYSWDPLHVEIIESPLQHLEREFEAGRRMLDSQLEQEAKRNAAQQQYNNSGKWLDQNLYNQIQQANPLKNETPDAGCKRNYGQYSYYNGKTSTDGKYTCDCMNGYQWNAGISACVIAKTPNEICIQSYGQQSYYTNKTDSKGSYICDCLNGYQWNTNRSACIKKIEVTPNENCKKSYGQYSYYSNNHCECMAGYKWNDSRTSCLLDNSNTGQNNNIKNSNSSLTCQANSTKVGSACVCNEGYIMVGANCISHTENCKKYYGQNVYGTKGNDNNSNCYCNSGYDWDSNRKSCIKKVTQDKKTISSPPASAPKKVSCGDGYALSLDKKTCVKIPKNAHVAQNSMDVWLCNSGYREVGDQCILADNPKPNIEEDNAKLTDIQSQDSKNNTILSDNQSVKEQNSQTNDNVKDKNKTNPVKLFFSNLFLKLLSLLSK